jgi:hypothetical protein
MAIDLVIIGCVKTKLQTTEPVPAHQLYTSPLFRKRLAYVRATGQPWAILSAAYGLIEPDKLIQTYNLTIADLAARQREQLRGRVIGQLHARGLFGGAAGAESIELHAGGRYFDLINGLGFRILTPTAGLGIGQQLAWYKARGA